MLAQATLPEATSFNNFYECCIFRHFLVEQIRYPRLREQWQGVILLAYNLVTAY